eukprot:TRINITY_DN11379_c0_g1_i1.p1 TRINITY_DN11379_c0_g1~~TRINITY_DN11379_c0_g1_i1.p1  ORF type:complete len:217 (-),score=26.92 TRINITY_DN11379_c0_g1_i1:907-1557(-)
MGFADRYIHAIGATNLKDDERHHQAEPLTAAALACVGSGDLGALLHRAKYAGTTTRSMAHAADARAHLERELVEAIRASNAGREAECRQALQGDATELERGVMQLAQLLRLWTAEVTKRGRARRWVPENTAWDADAAQKLYRTVAEISLAHWLEGNCEPCGGTGVVQSKTCKACVGTGAAQLTMAAGFVREHTLDMVSELHNIAQSHAARAGAKLR